MERLDLALRHLEKSSTEFHIVEHPEPAVTVQEKLALYPKHPKIYKAGLIVVQGAFLTYFDKNDEVEKIIAYFHDGSNRIQRNWLKRAIKVPDRKKTELKDYSGNINELTGLEGDDASSIFMPKTDMIHDIYFDHDLVQEKKYCDFSIKSGKSIIVHPKPVYTALKETDISDKLYIVKVRQKGKDCAIFT